MNLNDGRGQNASWIGEALKQLTTADAGSEIRLTTVDGELRVYRGELHVVPPRKAAGRTLAVNGGKCVLPKAAGKESGMAALVGRQAFVHRGTTPV